ncbi:MAG: FAD:protein FMN transferase [Ruminococcaceae bacterium]|nr:FAD:protein FMN transferase [Oscillospiraceae bacterium]
MKKILVSLLAALLLLCTGCSQPKEQTLQIFAMDTVMDFYAVGENAEETLNAAAQEINRLEALLSRTRTGSEVSAINGGGSVTVSHETASLLRSALQYAQTTSGAFDVTIAPLVDAWGIHSDMPRVLSANEIRTLLPLVGSDHVQLDGDTVTLDAGCRIDLGGIAKGYASDCVAELYRQNGVTGGWASLGGNVYAHGTKADGSFWNVSIRDPKNTAGSAAMVQLSNQFAVTSGGYQRYFTAEDGTVYQHIIDPATGVPAQSDLLSVTIIGQNGTMADAYSTALYVMGLESAQKFWHAHEEEFDMVLVTEDTVYYTAGLAEHITTEEGGPYRVQVIT